MAILRKETMSLVVRSRVCNHEECPLLFLTRATIHPYIIQELESSPNVLRALGPHFHWELLTRRSTASIAAVMGNKAAKIYHVFFWFAVSLHSQPARSLTWLTVWPHDVVVSAQRGRRRMWGRHTRLLLAAAAMMRSASEKS